MVSVFAEPDPAHTEARRASGRDGEEVGAQRSDSRVDRVSRRRADADGADHRGNAKEDAERRQDRAQTVAEQAAHSRVERAQ